MNIPYQFNSVSTKCRAMASSFLKPADYIYLSKTNDLKDIANYLSERESYAKEFKNIDLSKVSRNYLEQILNKNIYDTYMTLCVFTMGNLQKFIKAMMDKFEVDFILKCINKFFRNPDDITFHDTHFLMSDPKYYNLYNAATFQELQKLLENSPYNKIVKNIIPDDKIDIVYIETLMYDVYYNKLYNAYDNNDKTITARRVIVENLQRILRLKYNFNLEPNQIYPYLIHIKNSGNIKKLMELCELSDDKFIAAIAKYLKISKIPADRDELLSNIYIDNFIYKLVRKFFTNPTPSFETTIAFISLKEYEVKNLMHIIEGVRYQISSDIILKYIVGMEG